MKTLETGIIIEDLVKKGVATEDAENCQHIVTCLGYIVATRLKELLAVVNEAHVSMGCIDMIGYLQILKRHSLVGFCRESRQYYLIQ